MNPGEPYAARRHPYLVAFAAVAFATLLRLPLNQFVGSDYPWATYFIAVMIAAWHGGLWPGALAALLSFGVAFWWLIPPAHSLKITGTNQLVGSLMFFGVSAALVGLSESLHRALARVASVRADLELRQAALTQLNAKYESMLASISDGFFVFDRRWRYVYVNDTGARQVRRAREELLGQVIWDVFPDVVGTRTYRKWHQVMSERVTLDFEDYYPAFQSWFQHRVYPSAEGIAVFLTDVTARRRADDEIRRQRAWLETTLQSIGDAVIATDRQGNVTLINPVAARLVGLGPEQALGRPLADVFRIVNEHTRAAVENPVERVLREGVIVGLANHTVLIAADGHERPIDDSAAPIRDPQGGIQGAVLVFRDVSDRRRADDARFRLAAIVESSSDAIYTKDLAGVITSWNAGAEALYGYAAAEIIGKPVTVLLPSDVVNEFPLLMERLRRGAAIEHYETVRQRKNGERIDVSIRISPVRNARGEIVAASIIARDVSSAKAAARILSLSEEQFRAMFELAGIGTIEADPLARSFLRANRKFCELTGYELDELLGRPVADIVHPADRDRNRELFERALRESPHGWSNQLRVLRKSGETIWVEVTATIICDESGQPLRCVAHVLDITARLRSEAERERLLDSERAARAEAERASRMKDEFLSNISHELRTPLNAILGWAQILQTIPTDNPTVTEGVEAIVRNTRAQAQIIEDLLDMSRIIAGKIRLELEPTDLVLVLETAISSLKPACDSRRLTVEKRFDDRIARVLLDPHRMQQVVWNLLSNAAKFTPEGGRITVSLSRVRHGIEISVADDGRGIDPEFLPHVFDRFRQADGSTTRQHGGLGLGLSIVKQLVELHGGQISASSAGPGQGATFTVRLPAGVLREGDHRFAPAGRAAADQSAGRPDLRGISVLVVEDDDDARQIVERVLADCGATIVSATSGQEALELYAARRPDLLLTDIGMPDMDGYELLRQVRGRGGAGDQIPAVAVTAFARNEDRRRTLSAGFRAHISKPFEAAELLAVVADQVGRRLTSH